MSMGETDSEFSYANYRTQMAVTTDDTFKFVSDKLLKAGHKPSVFRGDYLAAVIDELRMRVNSNSMIPLSEKTKGNPEMTDTCGQATAPATTHYDYVSTVWVKFPSDNKSFSSVKDKEYMYLSEDVFYVGDSAVVQVYGTYKVVKVVRTERALRSEVDNGAWKWIVQRVETERHAELTARSEANRERYKLEAERVRLMSERERIEKRLSEIA